MAAFVPPVDPRNLMIGRSMRPHQGSGIAGGAGGRGPGIIDGGGPQRRSTPRYNQEQHQLGGQPRIPYQ